MFGEDFSAKISRRMVHGDSTVTMPGVVVDRFAGFRGRFITSLVRAFAGYRGVWAGGPGQVIRHVQGTGCSDACGRTCPVPVFLRKYRK